MFYVRPVSNQLLICEGEILCSGSSHFSPPPLYLDFRVHMQGLRMHPLSWNVYGGHTENVELLLKHGAKVNADFDSMNDQGSVTAMDIVLQLKTNEDGDERFVKMESILRKYGGKTMKEVLGGEDSSNQQDSTSEAKEL